MDTQLYPEKSADPETVEIVNPLIDPRWDRMLESYSTATIFHGSAWARVLSESYGCQPTYFVARARGRLLGLLPCMEVKSWIAGCRGVALPFTDQSEPLVTENTDPGELLVAILNAGRARGWKSLVLHGGSNLLTSAAPSLAFYTHSLDLLPNCDQLFQGLKDTVRRHVRQAQRNELTVEIGRSMGLMDAYYALHCLTRKKHGIPPQPVEFFHNIQRNLLERDLGFVAIARAKAKPVAGAVFLHQGTQAYYKFGASDKDDLRLRANNLVMWESICQLKKEGFTGLNFGRTSITNEGLRRYKLGWGTKESTVHYHRFDFGKNRFVADRDQASGFHNRIFGLMPIPALRWCGRMLYRHVA
jgi:CelD/BcsL family acetyltransferase involved in cellulose biosynthesis